MSRKRKFYMCGVDYQHELGECKVVTYSTKKSLKNANTCWTQCGIVEITVDDSNVKWIEPQDFNQGTEEET
jgi:hypothetical protein